GGEVRAQGGAKNHPRRGTKRTAATRSGEMRKPPISRMKKARKEQICMAYVLATKGQLPTHLGKLLADMRALIGDVSEADVRKAIAWALRQPIRPRARIIRRIIQVSAHRPEFPV